VKSHYDFSKGKRGPVVRVPKARPGSRFGSMTKLSSGSASRSMPPVVATTRP